MRKLHRFAQGRPAATARARPATARAAPALSIAMALALAAMLAAGGCAPPAFAQPEKQAIPTIGKEVAVGTGGFSPTARAEPGGTLRYRITLTLPQDVGDLERLVYVVRDRPDAEVAVNLASFTARVVDAGGTVKGRLPCEATSSGSEVAISLGDVLEGCPGIAFGDRIALEYRARVADTGGPGKHRNMARLRFDAGAGFEETVEAMAVALVPEQPQAVATALPQTGDDPFRAVAALAAAAGAALTAGLALARRRATGNRQAESPARGHGM